MAEEKIYVGSGKGKFDGNLVECSICLTDLPKEFIYEYQGKKYINLKVQKKKEIDKFGKSHSILVNTYKPEKQKESEF